MRDPSNLLIGQADGTFVEGAEAAGIVDFDRGRGAALADLDLDGRLDLVEVNLAGPTRIWRNTGVVAGSSDQPLGHWPALRLRQPGPNRDAIGAWLETRVGSTIQRRELTVGGGHGGGELGWTHVGLGAARRAECGSSGRTAPSGRGCRGAADRFAHHRARRDAVHAVDAAHTRERREDPRRAAPAPRVARRGRRCPTSADRRRRRSCRPRATPSASSACGRAWTSAGYDRLVVYADREHSANLAFLTGFDPRFEEAVLIVGAGGRPGDPRRQRVLGHGRRRAAADAPRAAPGPQPARQPRDRSHPLGEVLGDEGIDRGARVGVVGWKTFADRGDDRGARLPRRRAAAAGRRARARRERGDLLIDPADGLRIINDADELATLEAASCTTSSGVLRLLRGLRPGLRERDAVALLGWDGSPLSCHVMLTAGERARFGL